MDSYSQMYCARKDRSTTVNRPAMVREKLLTAPAISDSSTAREVPMTWEAVPKATP